LMTAKTNFALKPGLGGGRVRFVMLAADRRQHRRWASESANAMETRLTRLQRIAGT